MKTHEYWMEKALSLAAKGTELVSPNPRVGCLIVKGNRLVASGYHRRYGGPHAEVIALKKAGKAAKGATLYLTLEPCSTWGKTPPCLDLIVNAGIKCVVVASEDPNPKHSGKGLRLLRRAKIQVVKNVLKAEAIMLNRAFFKWVQTGEPYVTLKMAQSLDGKIATSKGESKWITSAKAREFVHELRREQDAILIGKNTLYADNPSLSVRNISSSRAKSRDLSMRICRKQILSRDDKQSLKPWRIVLDPEGKLKNTAKVFKGSQQTLVVVDENKIKKTLKRKAPSSQGRILLPVKSIRGRLNLKDLLKKLGNLGVSKILVEGGGELAWSFLEGKLVDEFCWFVAPKFIGGRNSKTAVEGSGIKKLKDAFNLELKEIHLLDKDLLLVGDMRK